MAKVPNLPPSMRGKGYKGASPKPLNVKRPPAAVAAAQAEVATPAGVSAGKVRIPAIPGITLLEQRTMVRVPNLAPSMRGKGYRGLSQKPLNVKKPPPPPAPPEPRFAGRCNCGCRCCAGNG